MQAKQVKHKNARRARRKARIRGLGEFGAGRVFGTALRPRLTVFRSVKHIYAQIIDDAAGRTLTSAASVAEELRTQLKNGGNKSAAAAVGKALAAKALAAGIKAVCFDRNGYKFHGRVKALADAAREGGLKF
jgi:large subunit ribosomal protein L18